MNQSNSSAVKAENILHLQPNPLTSHFAQITEAVGYDKNISGNALRVYFCLERHRNDITFQCDPGHRRIAELTGLRRPTIAKCLKSLEKHGHIKIVPSASKMETDNYVLLSMVEKRTDLRVAKKISQGGQKFNQKAVKNFSHNDTKTLTIQDNTSPEGFKAILKSTDEKRAKAKAVAQ